MGPTINKRSAPAGRADGGRQSIGEQNLQRIAPVITAGGQERAPTSGCKPAPRPARKGCGGNGSARSWAQRKAVKLITLDKLAGDGVLAAKKIPSAKQASGAAYSIFHWLPSGDD